MSQLVPTDAELLADALRLTADHRLQVFDALILAGAARAGCELMLTEDLHDGFVWRGVTVANPFGPAPDPRLARLLADPR